MTKLRIFTQETLPVKALVEILFRMTLMKLAILMLSVRLGPSCIELHYGSLLGTLSLLSLAIARLHRKLGQTWCQVYCLTISATEILPNPIPKVF